MFRISILTWLLTGIPLLAQSPNSWRGLTLEQSTIEDVVSTLGQPKKQKEKQRLYTIIDDWLDKSARYDKLEYQELDGIKKAELYFSDGALKAVQIELNEKINPNTLKEAYGIDFLPKVGGLNIAFEPGDYERNQGKVYPKQYPLVYSLIGVAPNSYIVAQVEQGTFAHFGKEIGGIQDEGSFPGRARMIWLIARSAQDRRGLDALK